MVTQVPSSTRILNPMICEVGHVGRVREPSKSERHMRGERKRLRIIMEVILLSTYFLPGTVLSA